jgi:hypothetical protein
MMDKLLDVQKNPVEDFDEEDGTPFDKLREECGVMAVYNHSDAARMTYWGLYALQHRGQESAGIARSLPMRCWRGCRGIWRLGIRGTRRREIRRC